MNDQMAEDYCIICGKKLRSAKEFDTCERCLKEKKKMQEQKK